MSEKILSDSDIDCMKIENLNLNNAENIIRQWAKGMPLITKIYLFGSRHTGISAKTGKPTRPNSDLDIALEFNKYKNGTDELSTWTSESKKWHKELLKRLGFNNNTDLDLQWLHPAHAAKVTKYVNESSSLIYISMEKWFQELNNEASSIFSRIRVFKELAEIIDSNNSLKKMDSTLLSWMKNAFINDMVIGIGRILDDRKDSRSLIRFLHELKNRPDYLRREQYVNRYNSGFNGDDYSKKYMLKSANKQFDSLAGAGVNDYPSSNIDKDIKNLTQQAPCQNILSFRHNYIAHLSKVKYIAPPTCNTLFKTFELLEEVFKKYNLIMNTMMPEPQEYSLQPFTVAWIENKT